MQKDTLNCRLYKSIPIQSKRANADCYCGEDVDSCAQAEVLTSLKTDLKENLAHFYSA